MSQEVELIKVALTELKPGHKYIIGLNDQQVKRSDMYDLMKALDGAGIKDAILMSFRGDPTTGMHVLEQRDDGTTQPA